MNTSSGLLRIVFIVWGVLSGIYSLLHGIMWLTILCIFLPLIAWDILDLIEQEEVCP